MANIQLFKYICCPVDSGGCGQTDQWQVSLGYGRVIMDCSCSYRLSLPLEITKLSSGMYQCMPLLYDPDSNVHD